MDDPKLNVTNLKKLKVYFQALKKSNYHPHLIPSFIDIEGVRTPIDKKTSLELLHSIPSLKDKNPEEIEKDLSNPIKVRSILGQLHPAERNELMEVISEKPHAAEAAKAEIMESTAEQEPVGAAVGGEPTSTMAGGADHPRPSSHSPNIPSIHVPQFQSAQPAQVNLSETGSGTAVINKAEKLGTESTTGSIQQNKTPSITTERLDKTQGIPAITKAQNLATEPTLSPQSTPKTGPATEKSAAVPRQSSGTPSIRTSKPNQIPSITTNPGLRYKSGLGNTFKNLTGASGRFFKRNIGKYLTVGRAAAGVGAVVGGITGAGLTGGASMGVLGGAIGGASLPSWIQSGGGGRFFRKAGNGAINTFTRLTSPGGGSFGGGGFFKKNTKKRVIIFFLGFFLLFGAVAGLIGGSTSPTGTSTTPTSTVSSDISSCKFTRSDHGPAVSFQSPLLLSYIQEAAQKANIPAVVLASFIRVESPSTSNMSDDQIKNYQCIRSGPGRNVSPTGALGIMQIQPPGTTSLRGDPASCDNCIDAGAKLLGKTVSTLTDADYCDVRSNIIIGAGWILKKMQLANNLGNGTAWDPAWTNDPNAIKAMVNTYYGCTAYGGREDCRGPYDYAVDVQTSINSCKPSSPTAGGTPYGPAPVAKLEQILFWAKNIYDNLQVGGTGKYDRFQADISNNGYTVTKHIGKQYEGELNPDKYWCTFLVADAYNLAGIKGLSVVSHGLVRNMLSFWQSNPPGYSFIPYDGTATSLSQIRPGYTVLRIYDPDYNYDHASIVKSIYVDARGDGSISTYDSNGAHEWSAPISDGKIISNYFLGRVVGFGGITE